MGRNEVSDDWGDERSNYKAHRLFCVWPRFWAGRHPVVSTAHHRPTLGRIFGVMATGAHRAKGGIPEPSGSDREPSSHILKARYRFILPDHFTLEHEHEVVRLVRPHPCSAHDDVPTEANLYCRYTQSIHTKPHDRCVILSH
jgi:hypothetical protein